MAERPAAALTASCAAAGARFSFARQAIVFTSS
jgi:hypothetical protein